MVTRASRQVVVIGGGIAGLTTVFSLYERAKELEMPLDCALLEASPRFGGKILTHRVNDLVIEGGPDSFLSSKPWALQLCEKLGLAGQLIGTNEASRQTFIYSCGRLREIPQGLVTLVPTRLAPLVRSGLVSWPGLLRMGADLIIPAGSPSSDESLASFFRRRFGQEAVSRMIEPLVAGIYAGDADQLSVLATFPRFRELEQQHGSLLRGVLAERNKLKAAPETPARPPSMFLTLRNGLGDLVQALEGALRLAGAALRPSSLVRDVQVQRDGGSETTYTVHIENAPPVAADAIVLATPAYAAGDLIRPLCPPAADLLASIPYTSTATVSLAYRQDEVAGSIRGFGFVVPRVEDRRLLAATWTSSKWAYRAPGGCTLVRCYTGGVGREAFLDGTDASLVEEMCNELRDLAGIKARPQYMEVHRWHRGMPQYTVGHLDRVQRIHEALQGFRGLFLTGAAFYGVGIPDCIREGFKTADRVIEHLGEGAPRQ